MRTQFAAVILIGASSWMATAGAAIADGGPVIVIPGKVGVPVIINGREASYAVVECDWGLGKSSHVMPTVMGGGTTELTPPAGHYFPGSGQLPGYGRLEVTPPENRRLPTQAESFRQTWSVDSSPPRPQQSETPANPPTIIIAPESGGRRRGGI